MADLSDVLIAIRDEAAAVLYPNGVPADNRSVVGAPVRVFVGWPDGSLDADLKKGICQVSVFPRNGVGRNLDPYLTGWQDDPPPAASLTATVAGETATFAGTAATPDMLVAVIIDRAAAYTYAVAPGDDPAAVAAALSALIEADRPTAFADGATLTVPDADSMVVRIGAGSRERLEVRRAQRGIMISAWCPSSALRDAIIRRLDVAFGEEARSLALPDGTIATITYDGDAFEESGRGEPLHRRDLLLLAEFPTVIVNDTPPILVPTTDLDTDPVSTTTVILS